MSVLQCVNLLLIEDVSVVGLLLEPLLLHGQFLVSDQLRSLLTKLLSLHPLQALLLLEHLMLLHLAEQGHLRVVFDLLLLDALLLDEQLSHDSASLFSHQVLAGFLLSPLSFRVCVVGQMFGVDLVLSRKFRLL